MELPAAARWTRRIETAAAALLTALVGVLHFLRLVYGGPLWRDEAGAFQLALLPSLRDVVANLPHEAFPLGTPGTVRAFAHAWAGLGLPAAAGGIPDLTPRVFGLLVGLSILAGLWLCALWTSGRPPLASLLLAGLNPVLVIYGDTLRGYGLGAALLLLTFGLLARLIAAPPTRDLRAPTALTALAAIASVQCLLPALPLLLAVAGTAAFVSWRYGRPRAAVACLIAALLGGLSLLPELPEFLAARSWSVLVTVPIGPLEVAAELQRTLSSPLPGMLWLWIAAAALTIGGALLPATAAAIEPAPDRVDPAVLLYCRLALPATLVSVGVFLCLLRYSPRPWYFVLPVLLAAATLEAPLAAITRTRRRRLAWIGGVLVVSAVVCRPAFFLAHLRMSNLDVAATVVAERATAEDLVIVAPWHFGVSFGRQYRGSAPWTTLPEIADHRFHRYDLVQQRMTETAPLAGLLATAERTLRGGHRIWLVGQAVDLAATAGEIPPPAPSARFGWLDGPYLQSWSVQLGAFLGHHVLGERTDTLGRGFLVNAYERAVVTEVWGWTDERPAAIGPDPAGRPGD